MELKITKGVLDEIHIYGAVEYAREEPVSALWLAWYLGENKIRAAYYGIEAAPKEADLTLDVGNIAPGKDIVAEILQQIRAIVPKEKGSNQT